MKQRQSVLALLLICCLVVGSFGLVLPAQAAEPLTVQLVVDARAADGGSVLYEGDITGEAGLTALHALEEALGEQVHITDGYVAAIQGVREFAGGPNAGWLYDVNGQMPDRGAGEFILKDGDRVTWTYSSFDPIHVPGQKLAQVALSTINAYVYSNNVSSPWHAIALKAEGSEIGGYMVTDILTRAEAAVQSQKLTDKEKALMALNALGRGTDHPLAATLWQQIHGETNLQKQGLNGLIFAILAADTTPGHNADPAWVAQLADSQKADGSFALDATIDGDVDVTAMALQALAPYAGNYQANIDRALAYLSNVQQTDGGFLSDGISTSESGAQVIIALQSLGINPFTDTRFVKNGGNVVEQFLRFQLDDGTFSHTLNGESNAIATEQAHLALAALIRHMTDQGPLYGYASAGDIPFADSDAVAEWAKEAVQNAAKAGWMVGYPDGSFQPKAALTRAEMVVLLGRVQQWTVNANAPAVFTDVPVDAWYAKDVFSAAQQGFVAGVSSDRFDPDVTLNRQTMAAFVMRDYPFATTEIYFDFADINQVDQWAFGPVQRVSNAGLMGSVGGNRFAPQDVLTREQAAAVLWRLYEQLEESRTMPDPVVVPT